MAGPLDGIGHLILSVRDMDRSMAFYRDALGLAVRFAAGAFAFLDAGAVTLTLRQDANFVPADAGGGIEIVFHVSDIHTAHRALAARGIEFRVDPRVVTGELWAADFRDPDGHVLSIFGPSAAAGPQSHS